MRPGDLLQGGSHAGTYDPSSGPSAVDRFVHGVWDGRVDDVIAALSEASRRPGDPLDRDPPGHPRRVLKQNVGYFTRHKGHMNYPEYRRRGWPIGSGVTEAAVKQFNKRVKGSEQFWTEAGVETILSLRASWISQDQRWERYWANRHAYCQLKPALSVTDPARRLEEIACRGDS